MPSSFFLIFILAEVIALVTAVKYLGFLGALGLIFLGIIVGSALIRWQGLNTAESFMRRMENREDAGAEAWDGMCIILAAILLMIPGFVTDIMALLLLLPPLRKLVYHHVMKSQTLRNHYWFKAGSSPFAPTSVAHNTAPSPVIDAVYEDISSHQNK